MNAGLSLWSFTGPRHSGAVAEPRLPGVMPLRPVQPAVPSTASQGAEVTPAPLLEPAPAALDAVPSPEAAPVTDAVSVVSLPPVEDAALLPVSAAGIPTPLPASAASEPAALDASVAAAAPDRPEAGTSPLLPPASKEGLMDLTLNEAVARALRHNPQALMTVEEVAAREAQAGQARSQRLPQLRAGATYNYVEGFKDDILQVPLVGRLLPLDSLRPEPHSFTTQVSLQQTLYAGGQIQAAIRASEYLAQSQQWQREAALQDLAFETRQAFHNVQLAEALVQVAAERAAAYERHLSDARALLREGAGVRLDVLRAETELRARQTELLSAETAREIARLHLLRQMGLPQDTAFTVGGHLEHSPATQPLDEAIAQAFYQRAELRALEAARDAAEAQVRARRGQFLPRAAATAQYQEIEGGGSITPEGLSVSVGAQWELYAGGRRKHEVAEARSEVRRLTLQAQDVRALVELDVRQAYLRLEEAEAKVARESQTLTLAHEAVRLARLRFVEGAGTPSEVLDAEVAVTQAHTALTQAWRDQAVALAGIHKAVAAPLPE